jgi:hypothetical protein
MNRSGEMNGKKKAGRPNKYDTHVKPHFDEILEMLQSGVTEAVIAESLGVNPKVFCKYKQEYAELNDLVKKGRRKPVEQIKSALFKRACGFNYSEKKVISKKVILKDEDGEDIPATLVQTEEYTKCALPDPTAAMMLLKHWDKDQEWTSDPASLQLKKEELELKKKHMESEDW